MKIQPIPLSGTSLGKGRNRTNVETRFIVSKSVEMLHCNISSKRKSAFTLVELIIVITILAILATIGFMSFQSYTIDARDGKRKADLGEIRNGLELYQAKNSILPSPDAQTVNLMSGTNLISIQGYLGANVLKSLRASDIKDPSDNSYYTYSVNGTNTKYQLLSMLENSSNLAMNNNLLNETYARTDYTARIPYTSGNNVGIFFSGTTNTPLQETTSGSLVLTDATNSTKTFKVMFSNSTTNSGTITLSGASLPAQIQIITNTTASTAYTSSTSIQYPGCDTPDITVGSYTIAACNIGTTTAGTGVSSYGNYFQWGNNGGTPSGTLTPNTTLITTASSYGPGNYYNNTTFIGGASLASPYDWASLKNDNLWGSGGTTLQRQGPCATGYHIPTQTEWAGIFTAGGWGNASGIAMQNILLLPFAGMRDRSNGIMNSPNTYAYYWSTTPTPTGANAYTFYFSTTSTQTANANGNRAYGFSLRCFKN